ncbi:MAG: hypothetical protein M3Q00_08390 [Pseudomonadota bacterium]|nr:hypothetical protein [Pseudomonadota bacterium]
MENRLLKSLRLPAVILFMGFALSAQAADPLVGTWKLNVAKSTYSPGPAPKSLTAKIEAAGEGEKVTADGVRGDDTPIQVEYTAQYDGKDHPITGSPIADTVSLKRLDANTTERTDKKGGKVVQTLTRKLSSDGKTVTVTIKGTDAEGRPINNLAVFEKQ